MAANYVPVLLAFSVGTGVAAIYAAWQTRRAKSWPTVHASIAKDPESTTKRWLLHNFSRSNADSDYCLEWTIQGVKYRRRLQNKAEISVEGSVLASVSPDLKSQAIRYNPRKPSEVLLPTDRNDWILFAGLSCVSLIALTVASIV
jgi:hypothetical protein